MTSASRVPAGWKFAALLGGLFVAEFLCFDRQTSRLYTWIYPRWNDQIQYLTEGYVGYESVRIHGLARSLWHALTNASAQGTLHDVYTIAVFCVAGPSRSAALAVNMLALLAWQGALAWAVWRQTRSGALAVVAGLLPLALNWPWSGRSGSAIDFRLDHLAMCSLGISLSAGLLTQGFRSSRWSLFFGATVGLTLLTRFLTGTYFVLIFAALSGWAMIHDTRLRRIGNLVLAAGTAAVLAGPIFWLNREWVWNYYFLGHFTGPESALRNPHMGLIASMKFVSGHLFFDHLGATFLWLAIGGIVVVSVGVWRNRARASSAPRSNADDWVFAAAYLLAPAIILTLHQQKSEVVVGALVPGAVVAVVLAWKAGLERCFSAWPQFALLGLVLPAAGGHFIARQFRPAYDASFAADARQVNRLADYIYDQVVANNLAAPRVAVNQVTDCLDGQVLRIICYERRHDWRPFIMTLPTGIMKENVDVLFERLTHSDFVFLTEDGTPGAWPYDRQMRELLPVHQAWCEAHLQRVERFQLFGQHMVLYQRPEIH